MSRTVTRNDDLEQTSPTKEGVVFAELLAKAKITPTELARLMGVSVHVIYGWNKRGVSTRSANEVANILKCLPQDISRVGCASISTPNTHQVLDRSRSAPIIEWSQCNKRVAAMASSKERAVYLLDDDIDDDFCFALKTPHSPGISVSAESGLSAALIVDPRTGRYADGKSRWGFIVDTNLDLPIYRQIEQIGMDKYLVAADDHYPTQPTLFSTAHHKILGAVIGFGLAMA